MTPRYNSIIFGVPVNLNTQFMSSGRAHRDGILAGCNLTAERDGLSARSLQSTRMNQTIEVANVRIGSFASEGALMTSVGPRWTDVIRTGCYADGEEAGHAGQPPDSRTLVVLTTAISRAGPLIPEADQSPPNGCRRDHRARIRRPGLDAAENIGVCMLYSIPEQTMLALSNVPLPNLQMLA
jgi:hypothetical protein